MIVLKSNGALNEFGSFDALCVCFMFYCCCVVSFALFVGFCFCLSHSRLTMHRIEACCVQWCLVSVQWRWNLWCMVMNMIDLLCIYAMFSCCCCSLCNALGIMYVFLRLCHTCHSRRGIIWHNMFVGCTTCVCGCRPHSPNNTKCECALKLICTVRVFILCVI